MQYVRDLPAVKEAVIPGGVFHVAAKQSFIHPNKAAANKVLWDGTFPVDKVSFMQFARPLTRYQREAYNLAREQIGATLEFEDIFTIDTPFTYMMAIGGYLLIDEDALTDRHFVPMLAHELGHLENGDSYVRAAFYFLGKGWLQENVTPSGIAVEEDEDRQKRITQTTSDIAKGTLYGGWLGGGLVLASKMAQGVGSSVQKFEAEVTQYFNRWDVEADAKAEKWVDLLEYQSYLSDWKDDGIKVQFDAPTSVRLEESELRQQPDYTPSLQPPKPNFNMPIWMIIGIAVGAIFVSLMCMAAFLITSTLG